MLLHWIWFAELEGMTPLQKRRLLERFQDPEELYHAGAAVLAKWELSEKIKKALLNKDLQSAEKILRACNKKNIGILPLTDAAYPGRLRNTPDAPAILYYKGILPRWDEIPAVGVVGTRKATAYGLQVAYQLSAQIAACGGLIVSGGASGVDTEAMKGALDAGYPVVGVLGCGVDVAYPRSNRKFFSTVTENGCLISEYPPGTGVQKWHFPARNRIISGISNGVLVVEAPERSGALITARLALEQGRDVFAVPGNINTPSHAGSNALLQDGAIAVLSGWDVMREYEPLYPDKVRKYDAKHRISEKQTVLKVAQTPVQPENNPADFEPRQKNPIDNGGKSTYIELGKNPSALTEEEQAVLALLTRQPQESADLIAKLDMPSGKVLSAITMLTVKGLAYKHPGGRISLK